MWDNHAAPSLLRMAMTNAEIDALIEQIISEPESVTTDAGSFAMGSKKDRIEELRRMKVDNANTNNPHGFRITKAKHVRGC